MSRVVSLLGVFICSAAIAATSPKTVSTNAVVTRAAEQNEPARLPLKRVVLYKSGVGYFEHTGQVRGNQDIHIDFTTGQLNDALKSLTTVDLSGGQIGAIRYDSLAPIDYRLKSLRIPLEQQTSRTALLNALRGVRVQIGNGHDIAVGRVFSVEKETKADAKGEQLREVTVVSLFNDSGEVRSFELTPATSVRILDRELSNEVGSYLNLIGSSRDVDIRRMTISTLGTGERNLFVSYISEVPVWKSTYRIVMPTSSTEKPLLQGWAIVDNTVGEDWQGVQLSLVAGAPQSFVQPISQPFYVRRPEIGLPESYLLTPQTHEGTLENAPAPPPPAASVSAIGTGALHGMITDPLGAIVPGATVTVRNEATGESQSTLSDNQGIYSFANVRSGNSMLSVQKQGFQHFQLSNFYLGNLRTNQINARLDVGATSETVEVTASAPTIQTMNSESSVVPEANHKDLGDLFEYDLKQKITIGKNQSALVPILQAHINAEKVTLWNGTNGTPQRSLWITNSSGLTLDGGTFNILEDDAFAGEGLIDPVKPNERRIISYAADQALRITVQEPNDDQDGKEPVTHLRIVRGIMTLMSIERGQKTYLIHDSDTSPRVVIIEHPRQAEDWKLEEGVKPEESTATYHRFRVNVEPGKDAKLVVKEFHPQSSEVALTNLNDQQVELWVEQKTIPATVEQAFRRILEKKNEISNVDNQAKSKQQEIDSIVSDQNRLRENMKALKGTPEEKALVQRYTHQLDTQEDRLASLRTQEQSLKVQRLKLNEELIHLVQNVAIDQDIASGAS